MKLRTFKAFVASAIDGERRRANVFKCGNCSGTRFGLWQIEGQDHVHVQCLRCDTSFCSGGNCARTSPLSDTKGAAAP